MNGVVLGLWLDSLILEVFSNHKDSMSLCLIFQRESAKLWMGYAPFALTNSTGSTDFIPSLPLHSAWHPWGPPLPMYRTENSFSVLAHNIHNITYITYWILKAGLSSSSTFWKLIHVERRCWGKYISCSLKITTNFRTEYTQNSYLSCFSQHERNSLA